MLNVVILATALFVCPGDVYTNEPREGCHPLKDSSQEGFSTIPEAPGFSTGPEAPGHRPSSSTMPSGSRQPRGSAPDSVNAEVCTLYKEYVELEVKTQGGFQVGGPHESQRWQTLKRMFQNSPAPVCQ